MVLLSRNIKKSATNKEAAVILAQAEAIQNARGYELVSVVEEDNKNECVFWGCWT